MRLVRIALENWRGVESQEIRFADGVTLIEGPNEIGKSSIIEALLTLVRELHTTTKQGVKAVKPVGKDVGSRVEAEIRSGDYHFVYAKTYNKSTGASLDILAPKKEQLTGREAHERVEKILNETVDLALWSALLAEQGSSTAQAALKDSTGLANALDEAAGSAASGQEDSALYEAVKAEYQKYFTLKAGRPQSAALEAEAERAKADLEAAQQALAEVESNAEEQERVQADVRRRRASLPDLEAKLREQEASWKAVGSLKQALAVKESQLEAALGQLAAAEKAASDRKALVDAIRKDGESLAQQKKDQQPLEARVDELKRQLENAARESEARRKQRSEASVRRGTANDDLAHLNDLARLADAEKQLRSHRQLSEALQSASHAAHQVKIDDAGLEALRGLDRTLEVARHRRDLAATKVVVTAARALELDIDGESVPLKSGDADERAVAAGMEIRIPDIASVRIAPPHSAAELEEAVSEAQENFDQALKRHDVRSLEDAVAKNEARRAAQQRLTHLKSKLDDLLGDETPEEIEELARSLRETTEAYREQRPAETGLPEDVVEARERLASAEKALKEAEQAVETARERENTLRTEQSKAEGELRKAAHAVVALQATLKEKEKRLAAEREQAPDDKLDATIEDGAKKQQSLEAAVNEIRERLAALAPETVEVLYTNAAESVDRAKEELASAEQMLAVLNDRLEQAQADGRFEAREDAERKFEELDRALQATRRRAEAAERLWSTLTQHRDAARQAYVRPLKEAIERLGQIVFGPSFEIEISDDWTLESRYLDGTRIPFDDLSVGAKEQLGILTRLAAAQIVADQGGVPLIIDDALGFSDPSRLDTMGAAISAAGKHCQIVILTCTPGRFSNVGSATTVRF